jgi:hypothetical protein
MLVEDVESGLRLFDSNELLCSLGEESVYLSQDS